MKIDPVSPFEHRGKHGTVVRGRCDLSESTDVYPAAGASEADVLHDVAQVFGFHGAMILPKLPSFKGYDAVRLIVHPAGEPR